MSENHGDNKIKQTTKSVAQVATMGNLFSKELNPEVQESQKEASPGEEKRPSLPRSTSTQLLTYEEHGLKFFDKAISKLSERNDPQVLESEKVILNAFLNEVRNAKPSPQKNWSALQHFIYFIYRHVISQKPCNSNEIFPKIITKKIRILVDDLLEEDATQLNLRLLMLIREYAIIARGHFNTLQSSKASADLVCLLSYYSAFCSAASKLAPMIPEFDFLIMENYKINWLCLNKSIFFHYVCMSPAVQAKIPAFRKLREDNKPVHKNLLESYACFSEDMRLIATRWGNLRSRLSESTLYQAYLNPVEQLELDWRTFEEQKKILMSNNWLIRSAQAINVQDTTKLDGHLLSLVGETNYIADFLIDSQGHCMCEDCLAAEFRCSSITAFHCLTSSSFHAQSAAMTRLITCYICQDPIALEALASHIVTKHHESNSQKSSRVYLTPHQKRVPKMSANRSDSIKNRQTFPFEGLFERNSNDLKENLLKLVNSYVPTSEFELTHEEIEREFDKLTRFEAMKKEWKSSSFHLPDTEELKHKPANTSRIKEAAFPLKSSTLPIFQTPIEPVFKIASEAPTMLSDVMFKGASKPTEEMQSCKAALDEFLKKRNDTTGLQATETVLKTSVKWKSTETTNKTAAEMLMESVEILSKKDGPKSAEDKTSGGTFAKKPSVIGGRTAANVYLNVNTTSVENIAFRKPQQKGVDSKMFEFLKNANTQKNVPGAITKPSDVACTGHHACGHKCRGESEKQIEARRHSCQETCEHFKESRKCDCAYCEVFGSSLPPHIHKSNETRDRLRTRLNQRKEKVNEGVNKGAPKTSTFNTKLNGKGHGSLNCTIKITGNPKISMLNGKSVNANATSNTKVNPKPSVNDGDVRVPPRVPEVIHPVPPPPNVKPVLASAETKRPPTSTPNVQIPISGAKKVPDNRGIPLYTATERDTTDCNPSRPSSSLSTSSMNSDKVDSRDINELLNYIEGNKPIDKAVLAQKKNAKKARQRMKKAEERERIETEKRLKEEARLREEKRKEDERLKAELLAKQLAEKQRRQKKHQEESRANQKQETKKGSKKKGKNNNNESLSVKSSGKQSNLIEETIPAMVTIKRVVEGSNSPATVTITLKGSTPESDKLLFTLVNGHNNKEQVATATINTDNKGTKSKADSTSKTHSQSVAHKTDDNLKNTKKKKKKEVNEIASKELQVTIAVDKNNGSNKSAPNKKTAKPNEVSKAADTKVHRTTKDAEYKTVPPRMFNNARDDLNLPMLRLPPGITITKIEGPPANRNCKVSSNNSTSNQNAHNPNVPASKSGVIVVETEKLIQQSITASNNKKNKKKNKKKKDQKPGGLEFDKADNRNSSGSGSSMVTLKNPIFHTLQTSVTNKGSENADLPVFPNSQQASIFKNENGMVTIRSPRLQNSFENGSPISNFLSDLKPMFGPEVATPYVPMCHSNFSEGSKNTPFNAREILSGLPGIEITKVDKNMTKHESENKKASQPAEVSIIPTGNGANGTDKFNFDRDDWPFESVFTPRDVLEEDMDAEERELEAFKRFCQQSIPPERKEKVAHLNVKDIILNKKRDVTYS